jgi:hypothetical protein
MAKFLFVYYGGKMAATPKEIEKVNMDWTNWFKTLGKSLVDGGMPTMPGKTVTAAGIKDGFIGAEPVGGYSIVQAADADAAAKLAKTAPGVKEGMKVAVYALMDMMMPAPKK